MERQKLATSAGQHGRPANKGSQPLEGDRIRLTNKNHILWSKRSLKCKLLQGCVMTHTQEV